MEIKKTKFADNLIVIGWIHFVLSILGGIFLVMDWNYNDTLVLVAIAIGIAGCFMGLCIVGFGKIINYLNSINYYASQIYNSNNTTGNGARNTLNSELPDL